MPIVNTRSQLLGFGFWAVERLPNDTPGTFWISGGYTFAVRNDGVRFQAQGDRTHELQDMGYTART